MTESAGIILLYCIATVVAITSRLLRVPYTTSLLLAGIALGAMHVATLPHLTRDLLFEVFLPGLLFEAAYHLETLDPIVVKRRSESGDSMTLSMPD